MKQCSICKEPKSDSAFNKASKRKDGLQSHCRDCNRRASKAYYQANREKHAAVIMAQKRRTIRASRDLLLEYLRTHGCADCGETDPVILELDHVRGVKTACVTKMISSGYRWESVMKEIEKCEVVCVNCHRRRTFKRCRSYRVRGDEALG